MRSKRLVVLGALLGVAVVATAAFFVLAPKTSGPGSRTAAGDPALEAALLDQGYPPDLAKLFSSITTEVVAADGAHYHYIQQVPALAMKFDVSVTLLQNERRAIDGGTRIRTARGFDVYPLSSNFASRPDGYQRDTSFFVPYESLPPDVLNELGWGPRARTIVRDETHPISFSRTQAPSTPGVVVQSSVTASSSFVNAPTMPGNSATSTLSGAQRSSQSTYDFVRETLQREGRGMVEMEEAWRKMAAARFYNRVNGVLTTANAALELFRTGSDWLSADAELNAAEDCLNNPTNRLAQRAPTEDPNHARATSEPIQTARDEVDLNTAIRLGNTVTNTAASMTVGGVPGLALTAVSSGNDAMLAETQQRLLADIYKGVVPCGPRWAIGTVAFIYSERVDRKPPGRGATNSDRDSVIEVFDGTVNMALVEEGRAIGKDAPALLAKGLVEPARGSGAYRWNNSGNYDCVTYLLNVTGQAELYASGGLAEERGDPRLGEVPGAPLFSLSVTVTGTGLSVKETATHLEVERSTSVAHCVASTPTGTEDGTASILCDFSRVDFLHGGTYFSDDSYRDDGADPNHAKSRSCRLTLVPQSTRPPDLSPPPPPPGCLAGTDPLCR